MNAGVSQLEYWRTGASPKEESSAIKNIKEGGPGAQYLSYDVFMGLSVLGGFLALDHLYLRSPLTFLMKLVLNVLTLGAWWLYDASQAVFNRDVVKVFGLGIPGMGPKGIGAGVLANEVPDKKHMSFFIYSIALIFGGVFGMDSFITGDKNTGFIRLVSLVTVIFAPVAIGFWLYNLYKFFFKTGDVLSKNWEYFGAPKPAEASMGIDEKIISSISAVPLIGPFIESIFGKTPVKILTKIVEESPLKNTVNAAISTVQSGVNTVREGIELAQTTVSETAAIADKTLNVVGETADAATKALELAPQAAALSEGISTSVAQRALNSLEQKGGASSNPNLLSIALLGTLGIIAVSGFYLTYRRSKKNATPRRDDAPPQPGVLRESDKKEPS